MSIEDTIARLERLEAEELLRGLAKIDRTIAAWSAERLDEGFSVGEVKRVLRDLRATAGRMETIQKNHLARERGGR